MGPLDVENFVATVLLYVFNIGFPASLLADGFVFLEHLKQCIIDVKFCLFLELAVPVPFHREYAVENSRANLYLSINVIH